MFYFLICYIYRKRETSDSGNMLESHEDDTIEKGGLHGQKRHAERQQM